MRFLDCVASVSIPVAAVDADAIHTTTAAVDADAPCILL